MSPPVGRLSAAQINQEGAAQYQQEVVVSLPAHVAPGMLVQELDVISRHAHEVQLPEDLATQWPPVELEQVDTPT